nr:MAG: UvrD-helicase domain-containing protein [Candidatus Methanoperedens sp.]
MWIEHITLYILSMLFKNCSIYHTKLPLLIRQLEAIKQTQPPHWIFTGAGTGKTTAITAKSAHIVEKENIDPSQILALT